MGARYCHICGADRVPDMGLRPHGFNLVEWLDFATIRQRTGFGTASLVFFVVGLACSLAALFVGFLYTANTTLDWQAVQIWRIQWLLGAAVAFLAAIALKRTSVSQD
jgi:cytosine/uracil/thiamine/allantoin permease